MAAVTSEYQKLVLDDINEYAGINHSVKASILERLYRINLHIDDDWQENYVKSFK